MWLPLYHTFLSQLFMCGPVVSALFSPHSSLQSPIHYDHEFPSHEHLPFEDTINLFMYERSIPALSLAITKSDRLVYAAAYGYASVNNTHSVLATVHDRFRLASVSKSIAAISIMNLIQEERLNLYDTVFGTNGILGTKYGSRPYNEDECNITVQHLLEHTSGFVNDDMCGSGCDPTYLSQWLELDQWDLIGAILDEYDPSHPPGDFASYSNFGYFILGRVVEEVTNMYHGYEMYVKEQVLSPLLGISGMQVGSDERQEREVEYYDDNDPQGPYKFHISRRDSVGAWIATPTDLAKILTAVDGLETRQDILNRTTRALMFQKTDVEGSDFAKGWTVNLGEGCGDKSELLEANKDGDYSGTNSWVSLRFDKEVSYAVVVNKEIPNEGNFHGARDLKVLMDGIIDEIEEWPARDLFDDKQGWR